MLFSVRAPSPSTPHNYISHISCAVSLALSGLVSAIQQRHHPWFIATQLGFLLVGIGSWLFHATLLYQVFLNYLPHLRLIFDILRSLSSSNSWMSFPVFPLLDVRLSDITVIWTTCIMAAMVWSWDVSGLAASCVYASLIFAATAITVIYMHIKDPTFHQVAYAFLTALVLLRSIYLLHKHVDNVEARKNMWWTIVIGVATFLTGFLLWIIDNECCDLLRSVRQQIGIPWAFFLGILVHSILPR